MSWEQKGIKWAWEDLNLHGLPQQILSLSRLPVSPQARFKDPTKEAGENERKKYLILIFEIRQIYGNSLTL